MARGGTGKQCANSLNGLAAATNHPADISPSKLQLKDGRSAVRNFREDHVVRKFDQLPNNEFEKLSHAPERLTMNPPTHNSYDVTGEHEQAQNRDSSARSSLRCPQRITSRGCYQRRKETVTKPTRPY